MILSKRFIAIIILSFIATYDTLVLYFLENIAWIIIVTIIGVLIPMYLLQKGIQYCETFIVMMSLCFIPVFTFFFSITRPEINMVIFDIHRCLFIINTRHFKYVARAKECIKKEA